MRKLIVSLTVLIIPVLLLLSLQGCGAMTDPWDGYAGPPRVVASFPTLACFTQNVAGDRAGIICLCTTTGPHDYQFNSHDAALLQKANIFFANGLTLDEHFTDRLQANSSNARLIYRKLADEIPVEKRLKGGGSHVHDDGTVHRHGIHDPHVWLGIDTAKIMVERIRDDLIKVDPAGAAAYRENAEKYLKRLDDLRNYRKDELKALKELPIVSYHEALAYFANSYELNVVGSIQPTAGVEPAQADLAKLAAKCKDQKKVIIAVEPQFPRTAAEVLQKELTRLGVGQVKIVEVDTLETVNDRADLKPGWYEERMKRNIDKLVEALKND